MKAENEHRRLATTLGVVGALAGTTAVVAAPASDAATRPGDRDVVTDGLAATVGVGADPAAGTYESCTAMFGLTAKDTASWVLFDVQENQPISPAVAIGSELQAVVTVHGASGEADVECEADAPAWSTEAEWLEYVRAQRAVFDLSTITGRYPYPGGPGYAIPVVDQTYVPDGTLNLLTETITVSGASVRFLTASTRFSVVGGSPQDLDNLSPASGADDARAEVLALDPSFSTTVSQCTALPTSATSGEITEAVAALGEVWGVDVDAIFPPTSPSDDDRCIALFQAQSYYFATATKTLTVGAMATVTVEPTPAPTTTTTDGPGTSTTASTPPGAAAATVVTPTFTG